MNEERLAGNVGGGWAGGRFRPDEVLRAVPARITIMLDGSPAAAVL